MVSERIRQVIDPPPVWRAPRKCRKETVMTVSKEKQEKRRESWRQANASVRIDGGTISPEFKALQERHIRGQITLAELRAELETMERMG
mgnify:CR=1 FL=1